MEVIGTVRIKFKRPDNPHSIQRREGLIMSFFQISTMYLSNLFLKFIIFLFKMKQVLSSRYDVTSYHFNQTRQLRSVTYRLNGDTEPFKPIHRVPCYHGYKGPNQNTGLGKPYMHETGGKISIIFCIFRIKLKFYCLYISIFVYAARLGWRLARQIISAHI